MGFWTVHGIFGGTFLILFLLLFPRITMLLSLAIPIGIWAWIAEPFGLGNHPLGFIIALFGWMLWFVAPRFLVASLATALYWRTNPALCIAAWATALIILEAKRQAAEENAKKREQATFEGEAEQPKADEQPRQRPARSTSQRAQQWWDVLGVGPTASLDAVKSAYRRVALSTHPDSAPDHKGDPEAFRKATEAYHQGLRRNGKK